MVALRSRIKFPLQAGFTLVELSIVLVIIGLIIGGVLVGRDLISAATIRSQISQIEKYNAAVNTFRGKYGYLPGDIPDPYATQYGFAARGLLSGQGDGNGLLQGWPFHPWEAMSGVEMCGENYAFWIDLSAANLIDGGFTIGLPTAGYLGNVTINTSPSLYQLFPVAKVGRNNFISVWSGGTNISEGNGINYFAISAITTTASSFGSASMGLTVREAYAIDNKIDDGLPQSGRATPIYENTFPGWAGASGTSATAGSPTTCYDNSASASGSPGVNGAVQHYSTEINDGTGVNCVLSIQFQ